MTPAPDPQREMTRDEALITGAVRAMLIYFERPIVSQSLMVEAARRALDNTEIRAALGAAAGKEVEAWKSSYHVSTREAVQLRAEVAERKRQVAALESVNIALQQNYERMEQRQENRRAGEGNLEANLIGHARELEDVRAERDALRAKLAEKEKPPIFPMREEMIVRLDTLGSLLAVSAETLIEQGWVPMECAKRAMDGDPLNEITLERVVYEWLRARAAP